MRELERLAVLTALVGGGLFLYVRFRMGPGPEELERLRRDHAALRARVERRLRRAGSVAEAPESTVLVGVPAPVAERLGAEVVTGFLREVTLSLHDLKVRKEDLVRVALPVNIAEGSGRGRLRFQWDGPLPDPALVWRDRRSEEAHRGRGGGRAKLLTDGQKGGGRSWPKGWAFSWSRSSGRPPRSTS